MNSLWQSRVKLAVPPNLGYEVFQERANGSIETTNDLWSNVTTFNLHGEFCLDELEGLFHWLLVKYKPVTPDSECVKLVGDYLRLYYINNLCDRRHGISAHASRKFINEFSQFVVVDKYSASKGGRVWLTECNNLAALQAVIIVLTDECHKVNYKPAHVEDTMANSDADDGEEVML